MSMDMYSLIQRRVGGVLGMTKNLDYWATILTDCLAYNAKSLSSVLEAESSFIRGLPKDFDYKTDMETQESFHTYWLKEVAIDYFIGEYGFGYIELNNILSPARSLMIPPFTVRIIPDIGFTVTFNEWDNLDEDQIRQQVINNLQAIVGDNNPADFRLIVGYA